MSMFQVEAFINGVSRYIVEVQTASGDMSALDPVGSDQFLIEVTTSTPVPTPGPGGEGGVTDHGALTGLGDDDHTQYHNNTRGDIRYYLKAEVDVAIDNLNDDLTTVILEKADLVGGLVPANQLPSYVDDVLEFANLAAFPGTGVSGKIYVAQNTNLTYRWTGSAYGVLDPSLALGETSTTAYRGDRGKTAFDHSQVTTGNPHGTTTADIGARPLAPRVVSVASTATLTIDADVTDSAHITAQAAALLIANPIGTPVSSQKIMIRIKDNGTARAISYGSELRPIGVTLPLTTVAGKLLYLGLVRNNTDAKWDVISVGQEA